MDDDLNLTPEQLALAASLTPENYEDTKGRYFEDPDETVKFAARVTRNVGSQTAYLFGIATGIEVAKSVLPRS